MNISRFVALILCLLVAVPVAAETFVRTGGQYELATTQRIEGNFLGIGTPVSQAGEVTGDSILLGNQITITGETGGDLLGAAVLARVDGVVAGDVRIIAGSATISGQIVGDVVVAADTVKILSGTTVGGDLLLYARDVQVAADVGGDVKGSVTQLNINGPVGGGVDVIVSQLDLGQMASVTESVRYASKNLLTQNINTIVGGTLQRNDPPESAGSMSLASAAYIAFSILIGTVVWLLLSQRLIKNVAYRSVRSPLKGLITGFIALFVLPMVMLIISFSLWGGFLFVSEHITAHSLVAFLVAMSPVVVLLVGNILLLVLALFATPLFLGKLCLSLQANRSTSDTVVALCMGGVLVVIFLLIPSIGAWLLLFSVLISLGSLLEIIVSNAR